jgi:large subunit ribosomal protein L22
MAGLQVRAVSKYIMGSPIKMRRVVNSVRGMRAQEALQLLALLPQAAADPIYKTVKSAVANAEENYALEPESLVISEIAVDEGPRLKRARYGARGRFKPIKKRLSHITVVVEEDEAWYDQTAAG